MTIWDPEYMRGAKMGLVIVVVSALTPEPMLTAALGVLVAFLFLWVEEHVP